MKGKESKEWTADEQRAFMSFVDERRTERNRLYTSLETQLKLPRGFIDRLYEEPDDWAYIVKLAVLCEAAVTQALVDEGALKGDADVWYDHFSNLPNSRRLELAHKLDILSKSDKDRLDALSHFRNSFAHQVRNLGGSLSAFFSSCTVDKKVDLSNKLLSMEHKKNQDWTFLIINTRLMISFGALTAIKSIAKIGLNRDKADQIEHDWKLADLFQEPKTAPIERKPWKSMTAKRAAGSDARTKTDFGPFSAPDDK